MRVLVSGASGFVGKALTAYLSSKGCEIVSLARGIDRGRFIWRPLGSDSLEDFDACVHLAGEPIAACRWSSEKKERILRSRAEGTSSLARALAILRRPPPVFISASAVGFYGDRGEELLDEGSAPGKGFLSAVCVEWERGAQPIANRGARVVAARFGLVLGSGGGVLKDLAPLFRMGLGGRLGSGKQWRSWIALQDLCSAIEFLFYTDSLHGPVNLVAPSPVREREFSAGLAHAVRRPAICPLPAWLLRLRFGQMADELLLASARVVPRKLCASGFQFKYPDLSDALKRALESYSSR